MHASRAPLVASLVGLLALFGHEVFLLVSQWATDPESGHGLLLAATAGWLAWQAPRIVPAPRPAQLAGLLLTVLATTGAVVSMVGAESRTGARLAMLCALAGVILMHRGAETLRAHAFPLLLLLLALPLPGAVLGEIVMPLQLAASRLGAGLLEARGIPVVLEGNIIHLPGRDLFVTEACSGLRSLWSLVSVAVLVGGLWLERLPLRAAIVAVAVPIAVLLNGLRVFLTGFLTYFVDVNFGTGFLHVSEGWAMFVVALLLLGLAASVAVWIERRWRPYMQPPIEGRA